MAAWILVMRDKHLVTMRRVRLYFGDIEGFFKVKLLRGYQK